MNVLKWIRILALATVAPFAIAASAADAAVLRYEVVDRFDEFKLDPDGNVISGDPLDKGFSVTGTMDATGLGFYGAGGAPFKSWNITETVRKAGSPDVTYTFTEDNSVWRLDQSPDVGLGVVKIDPFDILLLDAFIATTHPTEGDNTLFLESADLDQRLFWFVPSFGTDSFFASQKISEENNEEKGNGFNGIYLTGSGGNLEIGRRIPAVPVPAPLGLLATGMILLGCVGVRRGGRA